MHLPARSIIYAICCMWATCVAVVTASKSFPVTTLINAKWSQTPLYLEVAEYLADENTGLFWDFVKSLSELKTPLSEYDTESKKYISAMAVARTHLNALQLPLLKLIVSMHSLTPRIQAHLQTANEVLEGHDCDAGTFAVIESELACNYNELERKIKNLQQTKPKNHVIESYSFDHVYPGSENNTYTVILYGDIGTREFLKFHSHLAERVADGQIRYIARHYLKNAAARRVRLSGYGVELHLKSTEYKSQDDSPKQSEDDNSSDLLDDTDVQGLDFKVLQARFPALSHSLDQFRRTLLHSNDEIPTLKAWEFQDLGLKAAAAIAEVQGEESLQILQYTAQNFPMQSKALISKSVPEDLRSEIKRNIHSFGRSLNIVPPDGALFINGLFFDVDAIDLGTILETVRTELRLIENLHVNGIRGSIASSLLTLDLSTTTNRDFAIDIRDTAILWVNDIEVDAQYRRWPASVTDLLRPTFPGMLRNIRKNVFNLVLVVDPIVSESRSLIRLAESFLIHMAPVRLGLVFDTRAATESNDADYRAFICAYNYVSQKSDSRSALSFLTDVFTAVGTGGNVRIKHIRQQLKKKYESLTNSQVDSILDEDSEYDYGRQLAQEFVERLGFAESPQAILNGVPMQQSFLSSDSDFEEAVFSEIMQQTAALQKAVYRGDLTDNDAIIDYLMNQPHVMPRLNQRILGGENIKFLDLTGSPHTDLNNARQLAQLSNRDMTATLGNYIRYFQGNHSMERIGNSELHFLTLWVFADLTTPEGNELMKNALLYLKTSSSVRVAFIPNTEGSNTKSKNNLNRLVWALTQTYSDAKAIDIVLSWLNSPNNIKNIPDVVDDILASTELHMKMLRVYSQRVLGLRASERMVIGNGRIYGPLRSSESFGTEDFGLIDHLNALQYADKIRKVLQQSAADDRDSVDLNSDTLLKLYASLMSRQSKSRFKLPDDVTDNHSVLKLTPKDAELPYFEITAIIDPASRAAQKLAPILILFRNILNCHMRVFLTPVAQHSDMPVTNFYRYVIEPEVQFDVGGQLAENKPMAKFTGLPSNSLLTQNLHVPENWLVEAVRSVYDLDNIKLSEIGGPVHSEYELEFLLLEGHCFDATSGAPPRGLQMTLGTKTHPVVVDTIVMANLGYFQLKANPGAWELKLREGKSAEIYDITNAEGPNTIHYNHTTKIVISSLRSHVIKLRVTKKPEKQGEDLLGDDDNQASSSGIWNSIANSFSGSPTAADDNEDAATINIFSVASGHLYERLLRIMMISLLKHTKSPVKFWFLKNYLSPQFTDFLPYMAREYNFKYELVQYKWPRWLHQQTEKQRTIWGYKILFLDVLFPLNVRKIIFVDADAIVRADLKELYDMDLGGAPYAYTPFCDSRKEMEGFRFWKQGYWRSHLMGRRYHISALYVVDLKRFRKIAAGDRLRGQYQALSQDPNSLANLDQDLPNNMIHQVSIKSLPDEWLWCQTWCSDSSFATAKVIDLCNNPQTKEAKLTAAQRIVPEWKDYDNEIKQLMAKIEDIENNDHDGHVEIPEAKIESKPADQVSVHSEL